MLKKVSWILFYLSTNIILISQDPHVTSTLLCSATFSKIWIHGQIVSDTVLPSVVLSFVVRKVVRDPLIDARHCQWCLVTQCQCYQVCVGVVGFVATCLSCHYRCWSWHCLRNGVKIAQVERSVSISVTTKTCVLNLTDLYPLLMWLLCLKFLCAFF